MKRFKDIVALCAMVGALGSAIWLIRFIYGIPNPTSREVTTLNVLLFVLSAIFALISGYYFARLGAAEKVDTIARASTEKMVHLSLQLQHLSDLLREADELAQKDLANGPAGAIAA